MKLNAVKTGLLSLCLTVSASTRAMNSLPLNVQCMQSLCPEQDQFNHPFLDQPALAVEAKRLVETELRKPIRKYMGRLIHTTLIYDRLLRKLMTEPPPTLSKEYRGVIQGLRMIQTSSKVSGALERGDDKTLRFNEKKLEEILGYRPSNEELAAHLLVAKMIQEMNPNRGLLSRAFEIFLKSEYPMLSAKEATRIVAHRILTDRKNLERVLPLLSWFTPMPETVYKASRGENLSFVEKEILKKEIRSGLAIAKLFEGSNLEVFSKVPFDVSKAIADFANFYPKTKQAQVVATPKSFRSAFEKASETCEYFFTRGYGAMPTRTQIFEFQGKAQKVLSMAHKVMEETAGTSLSNNDQIEIIYPQNRLELLSDWKRNLNNQVQRLDNEVRRFKKFEETDHFKQTLVLMAVTQKDRDIFEEALEFCNQAEAPPLTDAALGAHGVLQLSWSTITTPSIGLSVLAHELGHVVFAKYRPQVANQVSCLMSKQGNEKYLSEDFADLFSTEVLRRLNYRVESTRIGNMGCGLLPFESAGIGKASLVNQSATDDHSSHLYRLLALQAASQQLTPQCTEYLKSVNDARFEPYCRWK